MGHDRLSIHSGWRVTTVPFARLQRARLACLATCMVPMLLVGAWLGLAPSAVYHHYAVLGPGRPAALHDQRVAATIMWAGGLPAFLIPALLRRTSLPRRRSWAWGRRSAPTVT